MQVLDKTGMKGTGKWTIQQAAELAVAAPTMEAALDARFLSGLKEERLAAEDIYQGVGVEPPSEFCFWASWAFCFVFRCLFVGSRGWRVCSRSVCWVPPSPFVAAHPRTLPRRRRRQRRRGQAAAHRRRARGALLRQGGRRGTGGRWHRCP